MNIFDRLKYEIRNLSLTDPKAWDRTLWNLIGSQSLSGENVTESTALTYSAFWNAVELISGTIAALPLELMQGRENQKRKAEDYKLYDVMHSRWNPWMTAKQGRHCLISHVLTWGNGYAEKVLNSYGDIVELWPITPNRCTPEMKEGKLIYRVQMPEGGADIYLPREKILHILGPSFDGFIGYSRVAIARKSLGLGMAMETFGSRFFGNGTHPSAVIKHPNALKDPKAMRDALSSVYSGLGNTHQLMLLEDGMDIVFPGLPAKDSQFLESRQFQIPEVARWFNLPPHKLKDLTKSSFNNIESEDASFIRDRILPDLVDLEQAFNMQLLTESDRAMSGRGRLYFKHNVKGLLRADTAARTLFYTAMLDRGVFCIDDVLDLEDMDRLPNGLGQTRLVQANMTTLENAGKEREAEPMPTPLPGEDSKKKTEKALLELIRR